MRTLPRTSHSVAVCLSLLFSYALLISNVAPFAPARAYGASNKRKSAGSVKDSQAIDRGRLVQQANRATPNSLLQSFSQAASRDGEVLVKFRATASEQERNVVALTHSAQRTKLRGDSGVEKLTTHAGQSTENLALALLQQPAVEFAEPNFLIKPDQASPGTQPNDAQFADQWALRNTGQNAGPWTVFPL